jgi:hypothetical protein
MNSPFTVMVACGCRQVRAMRRAMRTSALSPYMLANE